MNNCFFIFFTEKTLNYLKEGAKIESPESQSYLNGWLNRKTENPERKLRQMIFNQNLQLQSSENDQTKVSDKSDK